jgi:hypothetical protein
MTRAYEIYYPQLRERRRHRGREVTATPPLFPGYCFVLVVSGWWNARWPAGVRRMVSNRRASLIMSSLNSDRANVRGWSSYRS